MALDPGSVEWLDQQVERLKRRYVDVRLRHHDKYGVAHLSLIVPIDPGWINGINRVEQRFVLLRTTLPACFPFLEPRFGFSVAGPIRLPGGQIPAFSHDEEHESGIFTYFMWRVVEGAWSWSMCDLNTWIHVCRRRFAIAE